MFDAPPSDPVLKPRTESHYLPLVLSPMTEEDLPRVMEIDRASFATPWGETTFLDEIRSPACRFFVARRTEDDLIVPPSQPLHPPSSVLRPPPSLVGFLGLWIAHREMHVTTIGVDPAFRRRGVALQLMIHALEYGRSADADRGTLEVRRSNIGARRLYENLGFVVCGVRPGYYLDTGEDALLMWIHDLSAPETYIRLRRLREQRCIRT